MRYVTRVAFALSIGLTAISASRAAQAQSLTDTISAMTSEDPGPAAALGNWTTSVTPEAAPVVAHETVIALSHASDPLYKIAVAPSHVAGAAPASTEASANDYANPRGPRLTGAPHAMTGFASYYGRGEVTAAGEPFDPTAMTAAHRTLPFGTRVRVTRVDTGDSIVVRINDRGPFKEGRVIDLSEGAAEHLGMTGVGLAQVRLEVLGR